MSHDTSPKPDRRLRWSNWAAFALLLVLSHKVDEGIPLLETTQNAALDAAVKHAHGEASGQSSVVLIAAASRTDSMFGYPTRPDRLLGLVRAIDSAGAEVIGVDIKTHDTARFGSFKDPATRAPVVWVWVADATNTRLNPLPPIGGNEVIHGSVGLSLAVADEDGFFRRYRPFEESDSGLTASFARAILHRSCEERKSGRSRNAVTKQCERAFPDTLTEVFVVNAGVSPDSAVDAWKLLTAFDNRGSNQAAWRDMASKLAGKIVLVGGEDPKDVHPTPGGTAAGVFLQSKLVESELQSTFFRIAPPEAAFLLKLALGILLMVAYVKVSPGAALLIVASISGAVFWYVARPSAFGGYYVSVVPLLLGVLLDLIIEVHYGHSINGFVERSARSIREAFRRFSTRGTSAG